MRRLIMPTLVALAAGAIAPAHARQVGELSFEKCELPVVGMRPTNPINAECTTLKVPENWETGSGRQIELAIALVPSRSPKPAADPVFILAGGPGQSARESWRMLAGAFNRVLANRHVILLDQRGTGASNRFDCPTPEDVDPLAVDVDPTQAGSLARACVAAVKDTHDPRFYSTEDAALDLDRVRAALGAEQVNLVGISYGTRMGQIYTKRFPDRVRSLLLDSAVPNELILGTEHAVNLEATLKAQLARCRDDAECGKKFGDPYATLIELAADLRANPRMLNVRDPRNGEWVEKPLSPGALAVVARMYMYSSETAAMLPLTLAEAKAGRYEPLLAQAAMMSDDLGSQIAGGMHWSVICAEDAEHFAPRPQDKGMLLGQDFIATVVSWCKEWPKRGVPDDFHAPLNGATPTLVMSGEYDPVTPPRYGDQVVQNLPNARHLVVPGNGHSVMGRGCGPKLVDAFIDTADAKALEADCLQEQKPAPFFLNFSGSAP
ncbi:MAG TPA: alpha/beta hydrolase [Xanthomonadales bacterium]|nr:alpha/beta hydrolase [Xanthomonadales bacterium]